MDKEALRVGLQELQKKLGELEDIAQRPMQWAMVDLAQWLDRELPRVNGTIIDLIAEVMEG